MSMYPGEVRLILCTCSPTVTGGIDSTGCAAHQPRTAKRPEHPYGLDHPTWPAPDCYRFDTAEEAWASIEKTYGPDSGHIVVGPVPRKVHVERLASYPVPERPGPLPDPVVPSP